MPAGRRIRSTGRLNAGPGERRVQVVDEEIVVLEVAEDREVRDDAECHPPSAHSPVVGRGNARGAVVVDDADGEQQREIAIVPRRVEDAGGDQQHSLLDFVPQRNREHEERRAQEQTRKRGLEKITVRRIPPPAGRSTSDCGRRTDCRSGRRSARTCSRARMAAGTPPARASTACVQSSADNGRGRVRRVLQHVVLRIGLAVDHRLNLAADRRSSPRRTDRAPLSARSPSARPSACRRPGRTRSAHESRSPSDASRRRFRRSRSPA